MPTPTYTPLANITLGSSAASVTFSSISQAYRDLVLVMQVGNAGATYPNISFNSDTTDANYPSVVMNGSGSTTASISFSNRDLSYYFSSSTSIDSNYTINIMDYSATDKHKTALVRANRAAAGTSASVKRWANTAAITSITINQSGQNYSAGSSFSLYGIAS